MKNFEDFMEEVQQDLDESSLNRIADKASKKGIGFVSAERGDKTKKQNKERSKQLAKDVRGAGLPGPTKVDGQYIENDGSKDGRKVSERSYAVSSGKKGKRKFKKSMEKLGKKYDQDSVLVQKKPSGEGKLAATNKGGKEDLKGWDGKVGKMKPGGSGEIQTGIKNKTFTYEEFEISEDTKSELQKKASRGDRDAMQKLKDLRAAGKIGKESAAAWGPGAKKDIPNMKKIMGIEENYGDDKYSPERLQKDLPKGYKYGNEETKKGDHKQRTLQVDGKDTDIKIGGAATGKANYSPSWGDGHRKAKKVLAGIDKEVKDTQNSKSNDVAKRMGKAYAKKLKTTGDKAISDITGKGRKTNPQGHGNKARRRMEGEG